MTVRCTVVLLFLTGLSGFRSTSDSWGGVAIERPPPTARVGGAGGSPPQAALRASRPHTTARMLCASPIPVTRLARRSSQWGARGLQGSASNAMWGCTPRHNQNTTRAPQHLAAPTHAHARMRTSHPRTPSRMRSHGCGASECAHLPPAIIESFARICTTPSTPALAATTAAAHTPPLAPTRSRQTAQWRTSRPTS
jgi:hypothetical protein